jgi:hypothetical protein
MNKMNKVTVKVSESAPDKFRVIVNVDGDFSVGVVLTKGELGILQNEIREAIEAAGEE